MKRILFLLFTVIAFSACGTDTQKEQNVTEKEQAPAIENGVEVLCFHGKQRCATCIAIEKNTKAVVDSLLALESYQDKLTFRIIDITEKENEALAAKHEVTWSSLILVKKQNNQETAENLTEFAFGNARKSPDGFRTELTRRINNLLQE